MSQTFRISALCTIGDRILIICIIDQFVGRILFAISSVTVSRKYFVTFCLAENLWTSIVFVSTSYTFGVLTRGLESGVCFVIRMDICI